MCTERLAGRPVVFRSDGSAEIGFGHIIRSLTLAGDFQTAGAGPIQFVSRRFSPAVAAKLEEGGFPVTWLDPRVSIANDLAATTAVNRNAVIVTDSHEFPEEYYLGLKAAGLFVVSIDDCAAPRYASDILVNHHVNANDLTFWVGPSTRLLLGPRYFPLRRQFRSRMGTRGVVRHDPRVIVSLGGMPDPDHVCCVLTGVEKGMRQREHIEVAVVPGFGGATEDLRTKITRCCSRATVVDPTADLAALFASSDLAIVNGSVTAYEAAALGLPMIMIGMDRNQCDTVRGFEAAGACIALPPIEELEPEQVGDALDRMLANPPLRMSLGEKARTLIDGHGGERIVAETADRCSARDRQGYTQQPSLEGFFRPIAESVHSRT